MAEPTATANIYLQQLKAAAEAQMRRSAPQLDGAGAHKKQKVAENDQLEQSEHVDGPVGRYAYAAPGALTQGCTAFLGSCGFRRERSSTKEVLDILHKVLPTGTTCLVLSDDVRLLQHWHLLKQWSQHVCPIC